jgi:hypothetical protein
MREPEHGARARRRAAEFTRERMAAGYVEAYEQLLTLRYEEALSTVGA